MLPLFRDTVGVLFNFYQIQSNLVYVAISFQANNKDRRIWTTNPRNRCGKCLLRRRLRQPPAWLGSGGANSERAERDVSDVTEWRCPELYSGKEASEGHNVLHSKIVNFTEAVTQCWKKSSQTLALKSELTFAGRASSIILLIIVPLQLEFLLESEYRFF